MLLAKCRICGRDMELDGNLKNTTGVCRLCHIEEELECLQKKN